MFEQMVIIHAEERYKDLLREAEAEGKLMGTGPAQAARLLVGLASVVLVLVLLAL